MSAWKSAASAATIACCCAVLRFSSLQLGLGPLGGWIPTRSQPVERRAAGVSNIPTLSCYFYQAPSVCHLPPHPLTFAVSCRCFSLSRASCISSCLAVLSDADLLAPWIRLSWISFETTIISRQFWSLERPTSDITVPLGDSNVQIPLHASPWQPSLVWIYGSLVDVWLPATKEQKGREVCQNLGFHTAQLILQLLLHSLDSWLLKCFTSRDQS